MNELYLRSMELKIDSAFKTGCGSNLQTIHFIENDTGKSRSKIIIPNSHIYSFFCLSKNNK